MKKVLFFALIFTGLVLTACNKNQSAVRKLDGSWKSTSVEFKPASGEVEGFDALISSFIYEFKFENCKLKKDEWCSGTSTLTLPGFTSDKSTFTYKVEGDGKTLVLLHTESTDKKQESVKIVNLSSTSLTLDFTSDEDIITVKLEKVKS